MGSGYTTTSANNTTSTSTKQKFTSYETRTYAQYWFTSDIVTIEKLEYLSRITSNVNLSKATTGSTANYTYSWYLVGPSRQTSRYSVANGSTTQTKTLKSYSVVSRNWAGYTYSSVYVTSASGTLVNCTNIGNVYTEQATSKYQARTYIGSTTTTAYNTINNYNINL